MVLLLTFSGMAYGAEVKKIAVVDLQKIIDESTAGKRSSEEIKAQGKKMEETLQEKGTEIEELKKSLDQKALVLSDQARGEKENELREKLNDFTSLQRRYQDVLRDLNNSLMKEVLEDILKIAEDIGKREGYTLIMQRRGVVLYAPDAIDITDKVIKEYDALDAKRPKQ
jgi:outer membrane protein